jgi:hypothetical protein
MVKYETQKSKGANILGRRVYVTRTEAGPPHTPPLALLLRLSQPELTFGSQQGREHRRQIPGAFPTALPVCPSFCFLCPCGHAAMPFRSSPVLRRFGNKTNVFFNFLALF